MFFLAQFASKPAQYFSFPYAIYQRANFEENYLIQVAESLINYKINFKVYFVQCDKLQVQKHFVFGFHRIIASSIFVKALEN